MKKIVVLAVYFGEFPKHHRLFVESIKYNPTIDFKIFTDQKVESDVKNLEYVNMTMDNLNNLVRSNVGTNFSISAPYKCCDFRPAYGVIFRDYIKGYDFWGHCDLDVIFGDIRNFITDDILSKYDKVLPLGHLSLYRNTEEVNTRYMDAGSKCGSYDEVFSSEKNFAFDELNGIGQIYYKNRYPFYDKRIFADISILRKRFTLALDDKNYVSQIFYWENGHVYRAYGGSKHIGQDEFVYIHFKQRKYLDDLVDKNIGSFYICDHGFITKNFGVPRMDEISRLNKCRGTFYEFLETKVKVFLDKVKIKIKTLNQARLSKN